MSQEGCELGDAAELLIATFAEAARELGATQRQAHRLQRRLRHKAVGQGLHPRQAAGLIQALGQVV